MKSYYKKYTEKRNTVTTKINQQKQRQKINTTNCNFHRNSITFNDFQKIVSATKWQLINYLKMSNKIRKVT